MLIKMGVSVAELRKPIRKTLGLIDGVYRQNHEIAVVSSTNEGSHMPSSLHYVNLAVDVIPASRSSAHMQAITKDLKEALGKDYDIIYHGGHHHIEYDPKS